MLQSPGSLPGPSPWGHELPLGPHTPGPPCGRHWPPCGVTSLSLEGQTARFMAKVPLSGIELAPHDAHSKAGSCKQGGREATREVGAAEEERPGDPARLQAPGCPLARLRGSLSLKT